MTLLKRQLPVAIAFIAGLLLWIQYYVPSSFSQLFLEEFSATWAVILSGFALILGILSAIHHHWNKVQLEKPGFGYSLVTLSCFVIVVLAGWLPHDKGLSLGGVIISYQLMGALLLLLSGLFLLGSYYAQGKKLGNRTAFKAGIFLAAIGVIGTAAVVPLSATAFEAGTTQDGSFFSWIFDYIFIPLDATMFSLLAFFIASAAFRAFRARSFEATALLISGCIVMIGRVSLGEVLAIPGTDISFTSVAGWILNNPNTAAQRGILLGVVLSQVAISLRIMFGIERTYMGGGD